MRISVLLPVYNAGSPLRQAIESVLTQEFNEFEFLIIDDASTDSSAELIREYAARDSRIHATYHKSNQGLARTLNEGLELASGDLVARLDQDDEALPRRLRIQHQFMNSHQQVAVAGSYVFHMGIDKQRDRLMKLPATHSAIAKALQRENCIYHPSVIIRRKEILDLGGYRAQFKNAEDYDLWLRVSRKYHLANIPVALIRYRFSTTGMTLSRKWEQLYYFILAQEAQKDSVQPFSTYEKSAKKRLEEVDRSAFMEFVARKTAEELIRLGYLQESLDLISSFSSEIGQEKAEIIADGLLPQATTHHQSKGKQWLNTVLKYFFVK